MEKISNKYYDRAGDKIFLAYKDDNGHIITGYFFLVEDLDQQINFLKIKSRGNILIIPHSQILKIKIKEDGER
jgi:hypothetical protein